MKKHIETAVNILFVFVESLCKIILIFMVGTVTAQVVMRLFGKNISWCEEVMLIMLDALLFLLMPVGIKEDLHIGVEVFAKRFSQKARIATVYISNIILLGISGCMIYYGNILMKKTNSAFTITRIPRKYLYLITVIGGILCFIVVILKLFGMLQTETTRQFIAGNTNSNKEVEL